MAVIALPPAAKIRRIEWRLDRPAQVNRSAYTGARKVVANPWHGKWSARAELCPLVGEANVRAWRSFLAQLRGQVNTFRLPATEGAQNANNVVSVSLTAAAGAVTLTLTGPATAVIAGQLITVNDQLLLLTAVGPLSGGQQSVNFEPPLRVQAAAGTIVETASPTALVALTDSSSGWSVDPGQIYSIGFEAEETLELPFTPASLFAGGILGAWFDPSDLTSMWQDSAGATPAAVNSPVGKILDKSGNARHATQATSSKRPILRQLAGLYYLEFDGVDDFLVTPAIAFAQPFDRISAVSQLSATNDDRIFGATTLAGILNQNTVSSKIEIYSGTALPGPPLATGTGQVIVERHAGATSRIGVNNGAYVVGNAGTSNPGDFQIAAGNGANCGNIAMFGCVMVNRALTDNETSEAKKYMAGKGGVTL